MAVSDKLLPEGAAMVDLPSLKSFPTIRAQMGDWFYYLTTLPFYEVARRITPASEYFSPPSLNEWIQREVMRKRRFEIADYLLEQTEHFFSAIVVGVYLGEPKWYSVDVEENNLFGVPGLDERFQNALGILELTGEERLYAIDGQHRIAGIKEALRRLQVSGNEDAWSELANEDLGVVFVAADVDAGHRERIRRMFSTLNKTEKPVSTAELIALDEDDAGAIVTRRIATRFDDLNRVTPTPGIRADKGLVHLGKSTQIPKSNRHSITTIVTMLDILRSAFGDEIKSLKDKYGGTRPSNAELDSLYNGAVDMWRSVKKHCAEMAGVMGTNPSEMRAGNHRTDEGGHVLFRPIGQQAFFGALGVLRTRGFSIETSVSHLCLAPLQLNEPPWVHVMWNPNTGKMVNSNRRLAEALFLHMVGQEPKIEGYELSKLYQEIYGEQESRFDEIPVNPIG